MVPKVIFRCDASPMIGVGHVMRCLSLAHTMQAIGWDVSFVVKAETLSIAPLLDGSDLSVLVLRHNEHADDVEAMRSHWHSGCDYLIIDSYEYDASYEFRFRNWAQKIVVLDDLARNKHECDFLLDQTLGRHATDYAPLITKECQLLLGPLYAPLRPQFLAARESSLIRRSKGQSIESILINFGGVGVPGLVEMALESLARVDFNGQVTVVLGQAPNEPIKGFIDANDFPFGVSLRGYVDNIVDFMSRADLAIGATGTSSWERCCLGLPAVVVTIADNQNKIAQELANVGACVFIGKWGEVDVDDLANGLRILCNDPIALHHAGAAAMTVSDGRGGLRTILALLGSVHAKDARDVSLRLIEPEDEETLLEWQRAPGTRQYARNPDIPSAQEHSKWFQSRLVDQINTTCIINFCGNMAGVVRLDALDDLNGQRQFEVAIHVAPEFCRLGLAQAALTLIRRLYPADVLMAEVAVGNIGSQKLFERAGYEINDGYYFSFPMP